jgi:hypothetical protein
MNLFRLPSSIGGRIVALVAIIIVPIAVVCVLLATANYNAIVARVTAAQTQASAEFAVRTRLWFRSYQPPTRSRMTTIADGWSMAPCAHRPTTSLSFS